MPLRPKSPVFREAQKHIRSRLEKKWIPLFIRTEGYLERHGMIEKSNNESEEETLEVSYRLCVSQFLMRIIVMCIFQPIYKKYHSIASQ